jgi:GAF domain-containing protein
MTTSDHDRLDQSWYSLFDVLLEEAVAVTSADGGTFQLIDRSTQSLRIVASRGFGPEFLRFFSAVRESDDCACGRSLKQAGRIIVPDINASEIFNGSPSGDVLREAKVRAVQSTPLLDRQGGLIGVISAHWASVWQPGEDALSLLDAVCFRAAREIGSI